MDDTFETRLRRVREARGISQRELARRSGMTNVAISHIETGRAKPRRSTRQLLAWALDYPVEKLVPPKEDGS